nr:MAG TPA: hypothetical protein [Caudoviricetes sp.]
MFFINNLPYRWVFIFCIKIINIIISDTTIFKELSMSYSLSIVFFF